MGPQLRVRFAWFLLVGSLAGWPVSALLWGRDEPQFILGLSWLALTLTALDVLFTADVRREQDDDSGEVLAATAARCPHCGGELGHVG